MCRQTVASLLISWILINSIILQTNAQCSIDVRNLNKINQPAYVLPDLSNFYPLTSDNRGNVFLSVPDKQSIVLWCSGKIIQTDQILTKFICSNQRLSPNGQNTFYFNDISCREENKWSIQNTGSSCYNNGKLFKVGALLNFNSVLPIYTVCHDMIASANMYTHYTLSRFANNGQRDVTRPQMFEQPIQGTHLYEGMRVDFLYKTKNQKETIRKVIGNEVDNFITSQQSSGRSRDIQNSDYFLSRGHFAAMADFVLASHQKATFNFINVAPQWQTFNGFNWDSVEIWSRQLAFNNKIDLDVYTGTIGVIGLGSRNTPIYLYNGNSFRRNKRGISWLWGGKNGNKKNSSCSTLDSNQNGGINSGLTTGQSYNSGINTGYGYSGSIGQGNNNRVTLGYGTSFNSGSSRGLGTGLTIGQNSNYNTGLNQGLNSGINPGFSSLGSRTSNGPSAGYGTFSNFVPIRGVSTGQSSIFNSGLNSGLNRGSSNIYTGRNSQQSTNQFVSQQRCEVNSEQTFRRYKRDVGDKIPVPEYYYKVLLDNNNHRGVVLIGFNNPYVNPVACNKIFCTDQTSQLRNILWDNRYEFNNRKYQKGYIFACKIADFQRAINMGELMPYTSYQLLTGQ